MKTIDFKIRFTLGPAGQASDAKESIDLLKLLVGHRRERGLEG
jgi:hypothetical protein